MELRNLGNSGLRVSVVGLGCNNFGLRIPLDATRAVVHKALDVGINLFDNSDSYGGRGGAEEALGQVLGDRRKDIVLASKFCSPMDDAGVLKGASRRYIMSAVEASLKRLRTDWIDLYQLHRPDPLTPIEETLRALDDLIRQGKVRYIGCSNLPAWQVVQAHWTAKSANLASFIACQDEYNLLARDVERELVPAMTAHGLGMLPYFPLASGLLTGKYKANEPVPAGSRMAGTNMFSERFLKPALLERVERLRKFCADRGRPMLELAFSWLAQQPTVASVIAGATKAEQVEANAKAVNWKLSAEDLTTLDALVR